MAPFHLYKHGEAQIRSICSVYILHVIALIIGGKKNQGGGEKMRSELNGRP